MGLQHYAQLVRLCLLVQQPHCIGVSGMWRLIALLSAFAYSRVMLHCYVTFEVVIVTVAVLLGDVLRVLASTKAG